MKIVIYRDRRTNKIVSYHEVNEYCTEEALKNYNNNENNPNKAKIVELDEIAEYFYTLKTRTIKEEAEDFRDLMDDLQSLANRIDDRLYTFDRLLREERGDE